MCSQKAEIHLKSIFLGKEIEIVPRAGCNGTYCPFAKCQQISQVLASMVTFSWIIRGPGCTPTMPDWSKSLHGKEVTWTAKLVPPSIWLVTAQHSFVFLLKAFYWFIPTVGWRKRIVKYKWCNSRVSLTPASSALGALSDCFSCAEVIEPVALGKMTLNIM